MKSLLTDDTPGASPSATMLRLMLFPMIVGFLFVGGVFWLKVDLRAAGGTPEQTSFVQVHLLPRPDPVPIPVNQASLSGAMTPPSPANGPTETPATISNQAIAALPTDDATPSDPPLPSAGVRATADPVPSATRATFRTELLRHIARFERYPKAAQRHHLQGTVRTVFKIGRDGRLLDVRVAISSGQPILDQAAIDTIRRAEPLPPIPSGLPDTLKVDVAMGFDPS